MKTILSFLKPFKLSIIIAYSLTLVELAAELLFPLFLGLMIDQGIVPANMDKIQMWGAIMIAVTTISFTAGIINSYYSSHISTASAYQIREKLFEYIQQFSFEQLNIYPTSMLLTRFTNDIRQIQNTIFMALRIMLKAPLMVFGSIMMSFIVNPQISIIFLIIVPVLIVFLYWVLMKGSSMFSTVQKRVDQVNRIIQENIAGMRIIKAFLRRDHESNRFTKTNRLLQRETQTAFRFVEASMPVLLLVMNVSLVFILWFGNKQSIAGTAAVGDVVAIVNYALRTVMSVSMFTFIALAFSRAKASSERIEEILTEKVSSENTLNLLTNKNITGKITCQHVSFTYPNSRVNVLEDITFDIQPREQLAILGATGSGKSTLFQLFPRLYQPTKGNIFIDDEPIDAYPIDQLRHDIGYVSQIPLLFTGTIAENITFGKELATEAEVIHAAKDAQIHTTIMSFPDQYQTVVGQKGVNLSGGQKQRISIARALIRKPKILMLDDSTSALDMHTESLLLDAIDSYDCTIIIITQKVSTAKRADRILLLDEGRILHIDSHEKLLKKSQLYQDIVTSQSQKEVANVE